MSVGPGCPYLGFFFFVYEVKEIYAYTSVMENVATYSEARSEYTKQLATLVVPALFAWFQNLWSRNAADKQRCLSLFQGECEEVGRWNQDRITDEVRALIERSGCDYMEELMTAVFIAHTKVLTAIRLSTKQKKLSITVPKLDHFIHRIFKESARCFWKTPFLFMDVNGSGTSNVVERQKNMLQAEQLLTEAITTAVRGLLPVKQILKDYMEDDEEEAPVMTVSEVEHVPEPVKPPVKEPEVESERVVAPEPKVPAGPEVFSIDTEPSVKFASHDAVFDETQDEPEMRPVSLGEDAPSDSLTIDEGSATAVSSDDVEDLEVPKPTVVKVEKKEEGIKDDEVVMLE
jgi:hypothetical protein